MKYFVIFFICKRLSCVYKIFCTRKKTFIRNRMRSANFPFLQISHFCKFPIFEAFGATRLIDKKLQKIHIDLHVLLFHLKNPFFFCLKSIPIFLVLLTQDYKREGGVQRFPRKGNQMQSTHSPKAGDSRRVNIGKLLHTATFHPFCGKKKKKFQATSKSQ